MILLLGGMAAFGQAVNRANAAPSTAPAPQQMVTVESRYYIVHSDLPPDELREVLLRVDCMAEEYIQRTRGFAAKINRKFDFHIFSDASDYLAAGGLPGSAGVFTGRRLMAIAQKNNSGTWHVIQHEGFHQFASNVIGRRLPIWLNEGLAEYFGEGVFTGDAMIVGLIPPGRLARLKTAIAAGKLKSLDEMMNVTIDEWNGRLSISNYDQAWSMVQFLAHGDDGAYQKALGNFINSMSRGTPWQRAWTESFGDAKGFEQRWKDYWTNLDDDPSRNIYAQTVVATTASFLARATARKQSFASYDDFVKAAGVQDGIEMPKDDWLPPDLLSGAIAEARKRKFTPVFEEMEAEKSGQVVVELEDGTRVIGSFRLKAPGRVDRVWTSFDTLAISIAQSKQLLEKGKKDSARSLLQKAMREFPKSPRIKDAMELLARTK